jgi:hypothetical protein
VKIVQPKRRRGYRTWDPEVKILLWLGVFLVALVAVLIGVCE